MNYSFDACAHMLTLMSCMCIGICTGPRKEFWCLYCQELASGREKIFTSSDNGQLMYVMSVYMYIHVTQTELTALNVLSL